MALVFDYSNGNAVVQNGIIYYSPNCTRPVVIHPRPVFPSDPFRQPRLNASMFKQPIWWSDGWAWQSFVPLAPSFIFTPFEPLCAMPHIEEVAYSFRRPSGEMQSEIRYRMNEYDIERWAVEERRIVQVARVIQLRYGISASLPPQPSSFRFHQAHKTHQIAKRMICLSREWFAIWMGYVSYLVAKTASLVPNGIVDESSPAPDWYNHLLNEHGFSETWLDSLLLSCVCTFDMGTPRAGVIFQWSEENRRRESIEWFYGHNIPLWFVWSNKEEEAISRDSSLAYLRPPNELIQTALTMLLSVPDVPLAGLILQQYYRLGNDASLNKTIDFLRLQVAPSFVHDFIVDKFLRQDRSLQYIRLERTQEDIDNNLMVLKSSQEKQHQTAAEAALYGLLTTKRQAAAKVASSSAVATSSSAVAASSSWTSPEDAWTSPEDAWISPDSTWPSSYPSYPPYHNVHTNAEDTEKGYNHYNDFFAAREMRQKEMLKVESAGHREARESRAQNPGVKNAKLYEWEKTQSSGGREVYQRVKVNKKRNEDVFSTYESYERLFNAFANEWDLCHEFNIGNKKKDASDSDSDSDFDDQHYPDNFSSQPISVPPLAAAVNIVDNEDKYEAPMYSRDPLEILSLVYGYVPRSSADGVSSEFNWDAILRFLGLVHNLDVLDVPEPEKSAMMKFFRNVVSNDGADVIGTGLDKAFPFQHVQRPSENLFVFTSPPSNACNWVLGVHSPAAALYVCRYILENPNGHTILTVAHRLLEQGITFRTLLPLTCSPWQLTANEPYKPKTYRLIDHTFTSGDFDVSMLACQSVLKSPHGRAALLRGGIIGRIAKEFLSIDGVLSGPSVEVTAHRVGYIAPSGNDNTRFCDDELTDNEIATICGTYSLYTGEFHLSFRIFFSNFHFKATRQVAVWSWFPPPAAWEGNRSGCNWLTWTERCESVFQNILSDARAGKGKPKALAKWKSDLRGQRTARELIERNDLRSKAFMDRVVPYRN